SEAIVAVADPTFTAQNWETTQSVQLSAKQDDDGADITSGVVAYIVDQSVYNLPDSQRKSVLIHDDDSPAFVIAPKTLEINEGSRATVAVKLVSKPTFSDSSDNRVVVDLYHQNPDIIVDKTSLTFTALDWNSSQNISVSAAHDIDFHDESTSLTLIANKGDYESVSAEIGIAVKDDERASIVVDRQSLSLSEGATATVVVKLSHKPSGDVVLNLEQAGLAWVAVDGDIERTGLQSTATFTRTNWNQGRKIGIITVTDEDANDESGTLGFTATGGSYDGVVSNLSVRVSDPDINEILTTGLENPIYYTEGLSYTFGVRLKSKPTGTVRVSVAADDTILSFSPSSLTFTPTDWKKAKNIALSVSQDTDEQVNRPAITLSAVGGGYDGNSKVFNTTVEDDDAKRIIITPESISLGEGDNATIELRLSDAPLGSVEIQNTIHIGHDISADHFSIVPTTAVTFTADNWNVKQSRRLELTDDDNAQTETITVIFCDEDNVYRCDRVVVEAVDDDTQGLMISPAGSIAVNEGESVSVDMALRAQPPSEVELRLTPPLSQTHLSLTPTKLVFTKDNWNTVQSVTFAAPLDLNGVDERFEVPIRVHEKETGILDTDFGTPSLSVEVRDRDRQTSQTTPGIVMLDSLRITENINSSVSVRLANRPSGSVSVAITPSSAGTSFLRVGPILNVPHKINLTKLTHTLFFDQDNWNRSQSFLVGSLRDYDAVGRQAELVAVASNRPMIPSRNMRRIKRL
ncbi:MAG: hypothetical protein ISN28_06070, partial [Ectothiorhodospiraceae bacterium AqS1]|nr:hypothetical protein [Ectothiorhodospiraceae bacterium AqS1]